MSHVTRRRLDLSDGLVLAVLVVTSALMAVKSSRVPGITGAFVDDGVYLATAKALADGHGYRHIELPGEPHQTKYPPLYPLLLSAVWRLAPDFPQNMVYVRGLNALLWGCGSWLAYRLMRRAWGLPWFLPLAGVLLAFTTLNTLDLLRTAMSEPLYLVVSLAALAASHRLAARDATPTGPGRTWPWAVGTGVLAAAAYLTRSVGLSLIAAILADLALRRRWKALALAAAGPALALLGWHAWCAHAAAELANQPMLESFRYDLDYSAWIAPDLGTLVRIAYLNASDLALSMAELLAPIWTGEELAAMLGGTFWRALPVCLAMLATLTLLTVGAWNTWRRGWTAVHLYLLLYLGMVLVWPFPCVRFVVAVLPLVLTLELLGLYSLLSGALRIVARRTGHLRAARIAALAGLLLVAALLGFRRMQPLLGLGWVIDMGAMEESRRAAVVELIRTHVPADAVISVEYSAYVYLRTGRKAVAPGPPYDPVSVWYPPDRRFAHCGRITTRGMAEADLEHARTHLVAYLRRTQVTHAIPLDRRFQAYWRAFGPLVRSGQARLVARMDPYELYALAPPTDRAP